MKKNIIIDYLNLSSAIKLISNNRGSNVQALFKSKSSKKEFILIKFIELFGISYSLDKILLDRFSDTIGTEITDKTIDIARSIGNEYAYNSSSKINKYFNYTLKNWLFNCLWRQVFIIEYVRRLKIHVDELYIASELSDEFLVNSSFYQNELNKNFVFHYKTSSLIDDKGYSYSKNPPAVKYVGKLVSSLIELLYAFFFVRLRRKTSTTKIDFLVFTHWPLKWLNLDKIIENSSLNTKIVYSDGMVGDNKDAFHIRSISWNEFFSFYVHMFNGIIKFNWALSISINLFSNLLTRWKFIFVLHSLYKKYDVKIVLSGFEATINQVATAVSSDNKDMASFDCLWSIGERPNEFACTQNRVSDRYFLWGKWHHDLMKASNDNSSGHLIAGYVGDNNIPLMKKIGKKFRDEQLKKFKKIITVFDSGSSEDVYPENIYIDYLNSIIEVAEKFDSLVVLKIKNSDRYSGFIKYINSGRLVIQFERGSLEAALNSDVVIGVVNNGLASISAVHGRQVILYDPNSLVWNKWESYENSCLIVRSLTDLKSILNRKLSSNINKDLISCEYIDPYADGGAQDRMESYIQNVYDNLHLSKNSAMDIADNIYKKQWGNDKVILKNKIHIKD